MIGLGRIAVVVFIAALVGAGCGLGGGGSGLNCGALTKGLRSYRYSSKVHLVAEGTTDGSIAAVDTTIRTQGEVVTPDRVKATTRYSEDVGVDPASIVIIGDKGWALLGNNWVPQSTGDSGKLEIPFQPAELCAAISPDADTEGMSGAAGRAGTIDTQRFHFDDVTSDFVSLLPSRVGSDDAQYVKKLTVDIWLTKDNWPARLEVRGNGSYPDGRAISVEFITQVTDPNDEEIRIEPPEKSGG